MKHFKSRYAILLIFLAVFIQRLNAATFLVTNSNDSGPGSLRNAVSSAPSGSTIKIDPSLNGQTIYLTSGQIYINKNLEFFGLPAPARITVSTNYSGRAFYIASTASVSFISFSFHYCGYINSTSIVSGGAMYNTGNVFIRDSEFAFNTSSSQSSVEGGAVFNSGTMEIRANITGNSISSVNGEAKGTAFYNVGTLKLISISCGSNSASSQNGSARGGAIYNIGTLKATGCMIGYNFVSGGINAEGGCIYNKGTAEIIDSGIEHSSLQAANTKGGGIFTTQGSLKMTNATVTGNSARGESSSYGGGVFATSGTVDLTNCTIAANDVFTPSGLNLRAAGLGISSGLLRIGSTLVATNTFNSSLGLDGFAKSANVQDLGYNLVGVVDSFNLSASSNIVGTYASPLDPMIGPFDSNGGEVKTHALLSGSPAIDAGNPGSTLTNDAREFVRPINHRIDIGAYEYGSFALPTITITEPFSGEIITTSDTIKLKTLISGAGTNPYLFVQNVSTGYRKIKIGYDSVSIYNRPQNVVSGGNNMLEITLRDFSGTVNWNKIQVRPNGSTVNPVNLAPYIAQLPPGAITSDFVTIKIPISAFDPSINFTGLSFIELPYSLSAPNFQMGISKIIFTGGSSPFLWFGDSKTNNAHDGDGSGGQLLASLVPGTGFKGISKVELYNNDIKFATVYTPPYNLVIPHPNAGVYYFTAKAFNNSGSSSTTENVVEVTVQTMPIPAKKSIATNDLIPDVSIYPNPVLDILTIENAPADVQIMIYNEIGNLVFFKNEGSSANIADLLPGIYAVTIHSEEKQYSKTFRIVKQ